MRKGLALMLVLLVAGCGGGGDGDDDRAPAPPSRFDYDRNAALGYEDAGRVNRNYPIEVRQVSYASPGGRGRVSGFLVKPPGKGPFPGVILMHGAGGDSRQMLVQATWLAGRGAVALAIDSPFARNPNRQLPQGVPGLRAESDLIAQNVVELRRAVDVLREEANVDEDRIGFVGFSGGARTGAILAGNEDRIRAYVLMSGGSAPVAEIVKAVPVEARVEVEEILNGVDPLAHVRNAEPAKLLFLNGRRDQVVPRAALNALYRNASRPKEIRWYPTTHEPTVAAYRDMLAWLTEELDLQTEPVAKGVRTGP
jgi:dienelactone hydrolase